MQKVDYDRLADDYRKYRRPDPRIAAHIDRHLHDTDSVLNVGAGTGAYEPRHCRVISIEPSAQMIARRQSRRTALVRGVAENLPFADDSIDAAMAILTLHHWRDIARGLAEMRRVARRRLVLLTWINDSPCFWLQEYFPEFRELDRRMFPELDQLREWLGEIDVETIEIPADCSDGFLCAYWRRPEAYLEPGRRAAISSFSRFDNLEPGLERLRRDLDSGRWLKRYGHLAQFDHVDLGYRLVVAAAG